MGKMLGKRDENPISGRSEEETLFGIDYLHGVLRLMNRMSDSAREKI